MSDISKIKLPNGDIYNLKDSQALRQGDATIGAITGIVKQNSSLLTITDGAKNYPIEELKITFGPHQEGSGDPSPENVRQISGWNGISVYLSPTASGGTEYSVSWQTAAGTVYGGTLDVVNGLLTLTHKSATINETTQFDFRDSGRYVVFEQPDMLSGSHYADANTLCDKAVKVANSTEAPNDVLAVLIGSSNTRMYFYHFNTALNITTSSAYTAWIAQNPITYTYPLATPLIYQLTPQQINTLLGENNIWTNIDGIISIKYAADTKLFIQQNTVKDIQINNTSIVSDGIASMPLATTSTPGIVTVGMGLAISNDKLVLAGATASEIKSGASGNKAVSTYRQHEAAFYGLAKAAGDTTQSQSSNTIGTYTNEAKTAILNMLGINTISQPTLIDNNYIVNSYITEQAYTNGYISYMCNPFLTIAYINITTSAGLPANSNVFFGKVGRYPKNKIITNVIGVNNTVAQIIIDTDRKIYLYNASGTNNADTFSTIINIITTSNEVSSEQDTINGFPLLLDNAAYNNDVDTILGGTIENNDYAIIGPFDTGSSNSKALTFKTVPAGSNFNNTFIRYYSNLSAVSNVNYGITKPENTRTITSSYRYFTATVLKSEIDNFFVHDDTNNVYICKGANVQ